MLADRNRLLQFVRHYVAEYNPVPPLPLDQLKEHADRVLALLKWDPVYRDYAGVLINNEIWRETLASVPYEKRLLLLPKCLRVEDKCPAPFDEFGLLCKQCGLCSIQDLQAEAEQLGYAVLVAEGSAVVTSLIQTGKIEAVVGVSCLNVLERAFPYMEAAAIPGVAIPLLQNDCVDTTVDLDWVWDYIHLTSADRTRRMDLGALRAEVESWFSPSTLDSVLGVAEGETELIAREWLARAGKRWRPFLAVAAFQALRSDARGEPASASGDAETGVRPSSGAAALARRRAAEEPSHAEPLSGIAAPGDGRTPGAASECAGGANPSCNERSIEPLPADLRKLAVAVECFHKASLIHDDIEDNDATRYGEKTLHAEHGVPVALNVGDLLIGEGYRLLGACEVSAEQRARMAQVASEGQRQLCRGQGAELCWARAPQPLAPAQVIEIFRHKTAPAFEVALKLGAIYAAALSEEIALPLHVYSEALGIAYQIRDDLCDYTGESEAKDLVALRPSLLLAVAFEQAVGADKSLLDSFCRRSPAASTQGQFESIQAVLLRGNADERARTLLETYKEQAIRSLRGLENPNLKGLLRRVIGRIFNDTELKGWCKEFQRTHDPAP
jgi:geranylgeranyl pyrophosphate synthase